MTNIDELPCACGSAYDFESKMAQMEKEYEEKKKQEEREFNLPFNQKILSKNWKCRKSALDEISTKINSLESFDIELFKLFPKIAQEQHQGNLEFGIDIIINFYNKKFPITNDNMHIINETVKSLIEKGFSSLKASIKEKSKEAIVKSVENLSSTDTLCENINHLVETKNQKLIQAAVNISTHLLSLFGTCSFNYKIVVPAFIKVIDTCSPVIRNDIINFLVELYKWIRGGIRQYIDNKIKDSTNNDLEKNFEAVSSKFKDGFVAQPTLTLNTNCCNFSSGQSLPKGKNEDKAKNNNQEMICSDAEIDVFNNKFGYGEKFVEEILKPEKKWKEKKEMFDEFVNATQPEKILKIKNTPRVFFTEMLKIMLKDPNINVINSIILSINNISKGLRGDFTEGRDFFLILIDFFKEKKEKFTNDLMNTLESLLKYLDENVICDLLLKYTSQSLPIQSKEKVCTLIDKISTMKNNNIKPLLENILVKYTDDPAIEIRNAAIKTLGNIKSRNNALYITVLSLLNEQKQKRVDEIANMNNGNGQGGMENSIPNQIMIKPNPKKKEADKHIEEEINEQVGGGNEQEIEDFIKIKIGDELFNNFNEVKWDVRRDAFKSLTEYISQNKEEVSENADTYFKYILLKNKNFKENNVNVLKESLISIQTICETIPQFTKKYSSMIIKKIIDKIGDSKIKTAIHSLLNALIKASNTKFIINILIKSAEGKPVVVLRDVAVYITSSIDVFNISTFPVKEITDYCKCLEANSNPSCRSSATALLCGLYKYIGEPLKNFLRDIKEATMKVIEEEFKKVQLVTIPVQNSSKTQKGNSALIDSLFPRTDISKKITPKMLKDLSEGKWQLKKEVIDAIDALIVENNKRILPNGLSELVGVIKQKLKDGNKNIVRCLIQLILRMTEAMGNGIKVYSKTLLNPILKNLSDKNNLLREDVVKCLEKLIETIGFEAVAAAFPPFLNEENFEMRTELLKLLLKYKGNLSKFDMIKELIPGVIACLLDKFPSVRTAGEEYAKEMLRYVNINSFYVCLKDFKPAIANVVKSIIDKYASSMCVGGDIDTSNIEMKDCTNERAQSLKVNRRNNQNNNNDRNIIDKDDVIMKDAYTQNIMNNNYNNRRNDCKSNEPIMLKTQIPSILSGVLPPITNITTIKPKQEIMLSIDNQVNCFTVNSSKQNQTVQPTSPPINYEISKSPLILTKFKSVTESFSKSPYINVSSLMDQTALSKIISKLYTGDTNDKISSLIDLSEMISNTKENNDIIINNIRDIFTALNNLLTSCFDVSSNTMNGDLSRCLLTTYFKLGLKKEIISSLNLPIDIVYNSYEKILSLLLKENNTDDSRKALKSLNCLMLKLMESFNATYSFIALIKLMNNYKNSELNNKICSLSIKCLLKMINIIKDISTTLDFEKIIYAIYEFINEFEKTNTNPSELIPKNQNEDMCLKVMKSLLNEIIKVTNEKIWTYYNSIMEKNGYQDKFLKRWIQLILRSKNGMSQPITSNAVPIPNQHSPLKSNSKMLLLTTSIEKNNNSGLIAINNFADAMNKSTTQSEKEKNVYEIISSLKQNKLNVEYMADKLNEDNYTMLLKIYHSIRDKDDEGSKDIKGELNQVTMFNEKENISLGTNSNNISTITSNKSAAFQLKTLQEYRNKLYGLSGQSNIKGSNSSNTIGSVLKRNYNQEQVDNNNNLVNNYEQRRQQLDELLRSKREKLNVLNQTVSNNLSGNTNMNIGTGLNISNNTTNNMFSSTHNYQIDRLTEMKRKLQFLRNQKL